MEQKIKELLELSTKENKTPMEALMDVVEKKKTMLMMVGDQIGILL